MAKGDALWSEGGVPLSEQYPPGSLGPHPMAGSGSPPPPAHHGMHFPAFHVPDYSALYAQQAADAAAAAEAARLEAGRRERDDLYSEYLNAASSATDFINQQIAQEQANAALLGIEYSLSQEDKLGRIQNYFATIWGEGDQARLEGLFGEFGEPSGFQGFELVRGDASLVGGGSDIPGEGTSKGTSTGIRPKKTLATGEEETLGQEQTLLGG